MKLLESLFVLIIVLVFTQVGMAAIETPGPNDPIKLVQSVPLETDLAVQGMPITQDVWLDMIHKAKKTIDLSQFFLSSEPKGKQKGPQPKFISKILEALEAAAINPGVKIRLLVSKAMEAEDPATLERFRKIKGAQVRVYDLAKVTDGPLFASYWVVDGRDVFIGSQNFDWRSLAHTHELGIRVNNRDVGKQLSRIFEMDWKVAKTNLIPAVAGADLAMPSEEGNVKQIELVSSPKKLNPAEIRSSIEALLKLIQSAKTSLKIQLLDYSPVSSDLSYWSEIDKALREAAIRKVKIQMIVSDTNSALASVDHLKSLAMLNGVEIKFVKIPAYTGGEVPFARFVHSKYMIVDNQSFWIGSSNWKKEYFYNSRNVELIVNQPEVAFQGRQIFDKLWNSGYAEKLDPAKDYPIRAASQTGAKSPLRNGL